MFPYLYAVQYAVKSRDMFRRSRNELLEMQWQKFQEVMTSAYEHVPFYRRLWSEYEVRPSDIQNPDDLTQIPIVRKTNLRSVYPKDAVSDQLAASEWREWSTSGSTGEPFKFAVDAATVGGQMAVNMRTCTLSGYALGRKILQVAPPISGGSNLVMRAADVVLRRRVVDAFSSEYEETFDFLDGFGPEFIVGYASYIYILAKLAIQRSWHPTHDIRAVMTTSETLLPQMRRTITEAFQSEVFDQYGSNEFGRIAGECETHVGYHLNMDSAYVEILDPNSDRTVEVGTPGRLVITGLLNYAMPLIRYEIGDVGAISTAYCSCGWETLLLTHIGGRLQDVLWREDGTPVPPDCLYRILREYDEIENYQVVQESQMHIRVRVVERGHLSSEQAAEIQSRIEDYLDCNVEVERTVEIPRVAGKFKHIISKIATKDPNCQLRSIAD